jgi:TolB-like protein/tRNA A-37 threonylcarbamoyl transferase component Bud32
MGVVHEALDVRLDRRVAIKMIRDSLSDPAARARFAREARAAAAISHPNACHLHEIGEHEGRPFLVMELLDGEPLSIRLLRGPIDPGEATAVMLDVLSALDALHAAGLVHRDLKPSNVFLTRHGVKLLDFGLARQMTATDAAVTDANVTLPGTLAGTPRYMAPEQLTGDPIDARSDLFAAGVMFYELLTGRSPFEATSALGLLQAILRDTAPPLSGRAAALDGIVRRALQRNPQDRYQRAADMARDLRAVSFSGSASDQTAVDRLPAPPSIKLVVLPFRLLRPDEEMAFLEAALPDAITLSLSSVRALVVRSPLAAARFGAATDLPKVAAELDVNHVLTGTLLRAGDQIRATCQLIEAPGGQVLWSQTTQVPLGDLFQLQDDIATRIVRSLPLDTPTPTPGDVPASAHTYELYLRANLLAHDHSGWMTARALYEECVAEDPQFAPAWARLGRLHRVIGKFMETDYRPSYAAAERAFERALALNPDLSLAHYLYVALEVELGRADEAMLRLIQRIARQPQQAELFAALCQAARYCGLLDVSLAAHRRAQQLDPQVRTSVPYTHLMMGDFKAMLSNNPGEVEALRGYAYLELGAPTEEIIKIIETEERKFPVGSAGQLFSEGLRSALAGDRETAIRNCRQVVASDRIFPDGEGLYNLTRVAAMAGDYPLAIAIFDRVVARGFFCVPGFARDRWIDPLRGLPDFQAVMTRATLRHEAARRALEAAGGYRLLGLGSPSS